MSVSKSLPLAYVLVTGVFFAILQTGYFFQLQFRLTSAYPSFLAVTLAWLIGSAVGLWLSRRAGSRSVLVWLGVSLAAYYLVLVLLRIFPYRLEWLAAFGLLISLSGIHAGVFFGVNRRVLGSASRLFFWENNGFILGWIAGFAGYVRSGNMFHWTAPAALGLMAAALQPASLDADEAASAPAARKADAGAGPALEPMFGERPGDALADPTDRPGGER